MSNLSPSVPSLRLFSLENKNVLITGATRGIGQACALALAQAGASVCVVSRSPDPPLPPGDNHTHLLCDLSDPAAVKSLFQKALDKMGGNIHVLVNCAGIQRRAPSVEFSEGDWDDVSHFLPSLICLISCVSSPPPFLFVGHKHQSQVSLDTFPSCRSSHGSSSSWSHYKLCLSTYFPRWSHRTRVCCCQGCRRSAHQGSQQRMERP